MEFTFKFTKVSVYFWLYYKEKMLLPKLQERELIQILMVLRSCALCTASQNHKNLIKSQVITLFSICKLVILTLVFIPKITNDIFRKLQITMSFSQIHYLNINSMIIMMIIMYVLTTNWIQERFGQWFLRTIHGSICENEQRLKF